MQYAGRVTNTREGGREGGREGRREGTYSVGVHKRVIDHVVLARVHALGAVGESQEDRGGVLGLNVVVDT